MLLRRRVAIKLVSVDADFPPEMLDRFYSEMRLLAELRHPHIVLAFDAGLVPPSTTNQPTLHYLVMELVTGGDLEKLVCRDTTVISFIETSNLRTCCSLPRVRSSSLILAWHDNFIPTAPIHGHCSAVWNSWRLNRASTPRRWDRLPTSTASGPRYSGC
jgi:hypothetical protein